MKKKTTSFTNDKKKCLQLFFDSVVSSLNLWPCLFYHKSPLYWKATRSFSRSFVFFVMHQKPYSFFCTMLIPPAKKCLWRLNAAFAVFFLSLRSSLLFVLKKLYSCAVSFSLKMPRHQTRFRLIKLHNNVTHNRSGCVCNIKTNNQFIFNAVIFKQQKQIFKRMIRKNYIKRRDSMFQRMKSKEKTTKTTKKKRALHHSENKWANMSETWRWAQKNIQDNHRASHTWMKTTPRKQKTWH